MSQLLNYRDCYRGIAGLMPTRQLDAAERAEMVRLAMDALNDRQRMALLLSKFEGMTYADIAETMDLSTAAIKSLLSRARGNLRDIWTGVVFGSSTSLNRRALPLACRVRAQVVNGPY